MSYGALDIPSNSKYLKIEAGKPVDINILTRSENVKTIKVYFDGQKYHEITETTEVPDEAKIEMRYVIHVFDRADKTVKEFRFGPNIAIGIKEIAKVLELDGQTIHDIDLRISRVSEKPVRYQVVQRKLAAPIPQEILDEVVPF